MEQKAGAKGLFVESYIEGLIEQYVFQPRKPPPIGCSDLGIYIVPQLCLEPVRQTVTSGGF